jgi:AraC family transcriptional regulator
VAGFVLRELSYAPFALLPRHSHETPYISFVLEGRGREQNGRPKRHLWPDTMRFHPAGESHSNQFARSGARIFCIEVTPAGVVRLRGHDVDLSKGVERRGGPAARLGHRLYQHFRTETISTLAIEGLILELLAELLSPEQTGKDSRPFPWMKDVLAFLHASYREPVRLARVAQGAGVHPVHLARSFRGAHGQTLGEYVRRLRIEDACRRLITTDLAITEVAVECGFSDHSHFARVFRRSLGVSPSRFRRTHRR